MTSEQRAKLLELQAKIRILNLVMIPGEQMHVVMEAHFQVLSAFAELMTAMYGDVLESEEESGEPE
jgi:hypothetical protein